MKKYIKLLTLSALLFTLTLFSSCSKEDNSYSVIPEKASMVLIFNGKTLSAKAGIESFAKTNTFNLIKSQLSEEDKADLETFEPVLENSAESGIDLKKDYFFFTYKKENKNYFSLYFNLSDKTKFEGLLSKINEKDGQKTEIKKDGAFNYMYPNEDLFFVWDNSRLLFLISENNDEKINLKEAESLMNQKNSASINSKKDFADFSKNIKDIALWFDYSAIFDNLPPMQKMLLQSKMPYDMTGTIILLNTDFRKGEIVTNYNTLLNEEMKKMMEDNKIIKDKYNTDLLNIVPEKTFADLSFAFDFLNYYKMMMDMLSNNQTNTEMFENQFKEQTGMSIDQALADFSGEVSVNIHKIEMKEVQKIDNMAYYQAGAPEGQRDKFTKTVSEPVVYYSVALKMNSDKLFNMIVQQAGQAIEKIDNFYKISTGDFTNYFGLFDNKVLFTNDSMLIRDASDGKLDDKSLENSQIASNLKSFPAYLLINLDLDSYPQAVKKFIEENMDNEGESAAVFDLLSVYKTLEMKPKSNTEADLIIKLKDDSKNSLEVILNSFDRNIQAIND